MDQTFAKVTKEVMKISIHEVDLPNDVLNLLSLCSAGARDGLNDYASIDEVKVSVLIGDLHSARVKVLLREEATEERFAVKEFRKVVHDDLRWLCMYINALCISVKEIMEKDQKKIPRRSEGLESLIESILCGAAREDCEDR